jgi:DNA-binding response OmpR family regulator
MRERILVVEDDGIIRSNICELLELENYATLQASDGEEAFALLQTKKVSLIISDWIMPTIDGIQLLQKIKESGNLAHIPFIFLTAKIMVADKLNALKIGADDYLVKPFLHEELYFRCRNAIESRKAIIGKMISDSKPSILPSKEEVFIVKLRAFIQDNYTNENLSLADFIAFFNMGDSNFQKYVKRLTGKSVFDLVSEQRLEIAYQILSSRNATISEVIFSCGFKNANYFTKKFKDYFGVLPSKVYQVNK